MRGRISPAAAAKKRLGVGVGGGFALGCGCKDAKAVAVVAASSASPYSTEASTATSSATWRRVARGAAAHPSASGSTGTLTVPSASSSSFPFPWDDAEEADGEEVNCGEGESAAANPTSFSGLLRQLNDLEQSVVTWGPRKSTSKQRCLSPPPPLPARPAVKQRAVHTGGDRRDSEEGQGDFSPPPPPPPPPPPSFHKSQAQQQQHRKARSMDKGERQELAARFKQQSPPSSLPLKPEKPTNNKSIMDKGSKQKEEVNSKSFPQQQQQPQPQAANKHRKAKSFDAIKLDGTVAVVKQSADPLSDFRRSMVNMIVENRIVTGDELRELLRHFLALNAPHHHDAILRAFTEIWDEAFSTAKQPPHAPHREPSSGARPTPPRQRTPTPPQQRRPRQPTARAWR